MLNAIIKYFLKQGLGYVESLIKSNEAEIEAAVKGFVPGEQFDEMAWQAVKMLMPMVLAAVKKALDGMQLAAVADPQDAHVEAVVKAFS